MPRDAWICPIPGEVPAVWMTTSYPYAALCAGPRGVVLQVDVEGLDLVDAGWGS